MSLFQERLDQIENEVDSALSKLEVLHQDMEADEDIPEEVTEQIQTIVDELNEASNSFSYVEIPTAEPRTKQKTEKEDEGE